MFTHRPIACGSKKTITDAELNYTSLLMNINNIVPAVVGVLYITIDYRVWRDYFPLYLWVPPDYGPQISGMSLYNTAMS